MSKLSKVSHGSKDSARAFSKILSQQSSNQLEQQNDLVLSTNTKPQSKASKAASVVHSDKQISQDPQDDDQGRSPDAITVGRLDDAE
jgi:hypothetical protein